MAAPAAEGGRVSAAVSTPACQTGQRPLQPWETAGMLRWLTAGESHGPALVAVLEGMPAGVRTSTAELMDALARRRAGYGRGVRMAFERDEVEILGGVRHGVTIGGPVAVRIGNSEWPKWAEVMDPDPVDAAGRASSNPYFCMPARSACPGRGRVSARETAARTALGEVAA